MLVTEMMIIGPKIHEKIGRIEKMSSAYRPVVCLIEQEFEVRGPHDTPHDTQMSVNLEDNTCSCTRWQLTGIPYEHATCV